MNNNYFIKRNESLDVYISDQLLLNYLKYKDTSCNLQIVSGDISYTGYAFGMSKSMNDDEKVLFIAVFNI